MRLSFVLRIHTVLWKLCIPDSILKSRDITVPTKVHLVKSYGFASSHIRMWELDYKSWVPKNWCFWTVVLVYGSMLMNLFASFTPKPYDLLQLQMEDLYLQLNSTNLTPILPVRFSSFLCLVLSHPFFSSQYTRAFMPCIHTCMYIPFPLTHTYSHRQ